MLETIKELREKKTMKEKNITEQAQRAKEMQQQIVTKFEQDKKEIDDHAAAQNKCTRKRRRRDTNCRMR